MTPSLEEKVRFLKRRDAYAERPDRVEAIETHMSWVFLAGERVYKLKKPVAARHFDFTTLKAREANCLSEVLLNRRLAGDVYQGVARLMLDTDGQLSIDGEGETVDWLVAMRRLPADHMLHRLIISSALDQTELERLVTRLAGFYAGLPPAAIAPEAYLGRFAEEIAATRAVFGALDLRDSYGRLLDRLDAALGERRATLTERVRAGAILDGHGDLRPEHVCMNEPIIIFDCLEFSDELRKVDPVDELAFLGMECAVLGADWVGPKLIDGVLGRLGQHVSDDLVAFYSAYRAALRARMSLSHLLDPVPRDPARWRPLADRYAAAADASLLRLGL